MKTLFTEEERRALREVHIPVERDTVQLFIDLPKGKIKQAKSLLTGAVKQALGIKKINVKPYMGVYDREQGMVRLTLELTKEEAAKVQMVYSQRFRLAGYPHPPIEGY